MLNFMLHSLQPSRGAVNFILAQLYIGVNNSQLEQTIREVHPYDVPEILAVKVVAGNTDYLTWLSQETSA